MVASKYLPHYKSSRGKWVLVLHIYIFDSNRSSMVINLRGLDKYESNHTGDGKTDGQTRTDVRTKNIYELVRSNVMTPGVTEHRTLMPRVIIDTF